MGEPLTPKEEALYREGLRTAPTLNFVGPASLLEITTAEWADRCRRLLDTLDAARAAAPLVEPNIDPVGPQTWRDDVPPSPAPVAGLREAAVTKVCDLLWEHGVYMKDSQPLAREIVAALLGSGGLDVERLRGAIDTHHHSPPGDWPCTSTEWAEAIAAEYARLSEGAP